MLHCPGNELLHLVPDELERLLFDDIPHLKTAVAEHEVFSRTLRENGAEVVYLEDLMAEVLSQSDDIRKRYIEQLIDEAGNTALLYKDEIREHLLSIEDNLELVKKTMSGLTADELATKDTHPLTDMIIPNQRFVLDPIPNLYFTRDPFATIGGGAALCRMYSKTRRRETIFGEYILKYHPEISKGIKLYYDRDIPYRIEGGDILVLSDKVIAVGVSQRTTPEAIEILAKNLFADEECNVDTVLALDIPDLRAFMHLDTVFTQIDKNKFLMHPAIERSLKTYAVSAGAGGSLVAKELTGSLNKILGKVLNIDEVKIINCGGNDRVASAREQWNDGSNTLCIKPGTVVVYDRNDITNELLDKNGINVIEIPSSELSRGRGGPRCMSMPLERKDV